MERQTILIVDDAEMNRMMLSDMLGDQYDYVEAADGREALRILEKNVSIDLILLDINMPEMNGFEVLEEMNRYHWIEEVPVIMITAEESVESMEHAYSLGVTDYIPRPFNVYIVRRRVENTLNLYVNQKRLMRLVSDQIAEKEENNTLMVSILSNVVEIRNHESGDHIRNIRRITELLLHQLVQKTKAYHLSEEDIALIMTASSLHDIGKITIPEEILNKPGKLTKEEFEIMKTHSTAGAQILEQMKYGQDKPLYRYALEICRWHHERWDGHGYPDGLMGEEIPISAQIVAIADVYDALTSERCYKKAYDHTTAINMILNGECGAFNPLLLECLTETAPQIRIVTGVNGDAMPYRFELNRLSEEILAHADLPKNDRVQNLLATMQERIDFFASTSGGIQFEYDAVSRLADVTNWNEPPQYRHSVKNVTRVNDFRYLSQHDFKRLRDAMDATTKENPEFALSILFPVGNEYHWCDLRVRTLWSDFRPDHYIAAVGQLLDPQMKEEKEFPSQGGPLDSTSPVVLQNIRCLQSVFDTVRLIDPTTYEVLDLDEAGVLRHSKQHCAAFWNNEGVCANCISARAYAQKSTLNKLEFTSTDMYFVVSKYLNLNGTPCVLELLSRLDEGRWIDANGTRLLLDRNHDGNMDLFLDPVTDTYSRRYYETYRAHLEGMESTAIIDANRFKQVNDSFGHPAGDAVLREIARAIKDCIRKTDILIRYGGDEFLLLFPKMSEEILERKMQEISSAVENIRIADYPELRLSISIGGVTGVHPITEAIRQADLRMYAQKQAYNHEHQLDN
ncbi:HD domain-containing phosphohydrolase [Oribacterium sp. HCP3S3_B9]|uniref:HD domain-containing phosphohydrolase n=1 Tax=Oribacterium sp. HCP3S3_B9 TaxID=3438946 RepID=UPI003F88816C